MAGVVGGGGAAAESANDGDVSAARTTASTNVLHIVMPKSVRGRRRRI